MPKVVTAGARPSRLRAGPPEERDALGPIVAESRKAAVQPGRGPDLREPRVQPGRGLDLRGDLDVEAAEPRTRNHLRPGPPKDREVEDTRLQFGPIAQPAVDPEPARPESVGQRKNFQVASQAFARFLRQNSEAFAEAVEALGDGDASGFAQAWLEDYDRRAEEIIDRVAPELRPLFSTDLEAHRAESYNEAYAVERDRGILAIRQGITSTRQEYLKLVGQEPARLDYAFQKMEEMIRASGLRPDLIEEEVLAARRAIFTSYRQARLAGPNPEALLREMEAGRFEGLLPPEEMEALVVQTTAEVGQRQRAALMERQVDADTRQRLELQRLRAGEGADPHITPDALREIFPGEVGERKARQLEFERRRAEVRARTALMTPAEIEAAFGVFESESGTRGEAPDQTLAAGQGDETLAGGTESDRLEGGEGADTLGSQSSEVEPSARDAKEEVLDNQGAEAGDATDSFSNSDAEQGIQDNKRSLREDPQEHVLTHVPAIRDAFAAADALDAQAADPSLTSNQRAALVEEAAAQRQRAIGLSLDMQERLKGSTEGTRVLSKTEAVSMAREIGSLPNDQQAARWQYIKDTYGPYADRVLNELMDAGLGTDRGGTAVLVMSGAPQTVIDAWGRALGKSMEQLKAESTFPDRIVSAVHDRVGERFVALAGNGREQEAQARANMAVRLALLLFEEGDSNAATTAARVFFPFQTVSDSLVVSNGAAERFGALGGVRQIKWTLDQMLRDVTADTIGFSFAAVENDIDDRLSQRQLERLYADHVRGQGRWRNTCDGVQLIDGAGRPVRHKDGSFIAFTWDEIEANTRQNRFARQPRVGPEFAAN